MTSPAAPTPLRPEVEAAIRQRVEAATPGPWTTHGTYVEYADGLFEVNSTGRYGTWAADAAFIAAARTDIPVLLAEIDRLRERIGRCIDFMQVRNPALFDDFCATVGMAVLAALPAAAAVSGAEEEAPK